MKPALHVLDLGLVEFTRALTLQRRAAVMRIAGELPEDLLILCEHPPVVTLGRSAKSAGHVRLSVEALTERGAALHEIERGGDVTFHGPGQLVGYAIIDLKQHKKDLHWFLRQTEEVIIRAVAAVGVIAERNAGFTGVWVQGRKLASIGVHARDWVTWHGFALNVTTDLSWFDTIVPCGIDGVTMTSVEREMATASSATLACAVQTATTQAFAEVFALHAMVMPAGLRSALESEHESCGRF